MVKERYCLFSVLLSFMFWIGFCQECFISQDIHIHQKFPDNIYLTYGENRNYSLKRYWSGTNLNYSLPQLANITVTNQLVNETSYSFKDFIEANNLGEIVNILWDDKSVVNSDHWAESAYLVILTYDGETFKLVIGNISSLSKSQGYILETLSVAPDKPIICYNTVQVAAFSYYVDCMDISNWNNNYFLYVQVHGLNCTILPISNSANFPYARPDFERHTLTVATSHGKYLLRYYDGFSLPSNTPTNLEVWNINNLKLPILSVLYQGSKIDFVSNISTIQASNSYLYISSCNEELTVVSNWYSTQWSIYSHYVFSKMIIKASTLRVAMDNGIYGERLIIVGSIQNTNLTALVLDEDNFIGYFKIPVTSDSQFLPFKFEVSSITQGSDFFALSYQIADGASNEFCYYVAIFDMSSGMNDCNSLLYYDQITYPSLIMIDPHQENTLIVIGKDFFWQEWSMALPHLRIQNLYSSVNFTLQVGEFSQSINIQVLMPNDTNIYVANLPSTSIRNGANVTLQLDNLFYGPQLSFSVDFQEQNVSSSIIASRRIPIKNLLDLQKFIAFHTNDAGPGNMLKIFDYRMDKFYVHYGSFTIQSRYCIEDLEFISPVPISYNISSYYSIAGYDIFLSTNNGTYLTFTLLTLDIERATKNFVLNLSSITNCSDPSTVQLTASNQYIYVLCVDHLNRAINNLTITTQPEFALYSQINITAAQVDDDFLPTDIQLHPAYPHTIFVQSENYIYIVNYTEIQNKTSFQISFSKFRTQLDNGIHYKLQPFINSLFIIAPQINTILQFDTSDMLAPYYRRSLNLYTYSITITEESYVLKGMAYSPHTNNLYLLANETNSSTVTLLVIRPDDANSYLANSITILPTNQITTLAIDCTTTSEIRLGDIIMITFGDKQLFYEVYKTPYLTFITPFNPGPQLNKIQELEIYAFNMWNSASLNFNLTILDDEEGIYTSQPPNLPDNSSQFSFSINSYIFGTIFNITSSTPGITFTPLVSEPRNIYNLTQANVTQMRSAWVMAHNIYILDQEKLVIYDGQNNVTSHFSLTNYANQTCQSLYIDDFEVLGTVECIDQNGASGLIGFSVENPNQSLCNITPVLNYKKIVIERTERYLSLLTEQGQDNSVIVLYRIDALWCVMDNAFFRIPQWALNSSNPKIVSFDMYFYNTTRDKVYDFFIVDLNSGLMVVNFDVNSLSYQFVWQALFSDIFGKWLLLPQDYNVVDIHIREERCNELENCLISILLVSENFHTFLFTATISNSGYQVNLSEQFICLMVPQDYQISDWELTETMVILVGTNRTEIDPSIDALLYNITTPLIGSFRNSLDSQDPTIYLTPIWLVKLVESRNDYLLKTQGVLPHPFIFLLDCIDNKTLPITKQECDETIQAVLYLPQIEEQAINAFKIKNKITLIWNDGPTFPTNIPIGINISNNFQTKTFFWPSKSGPRHDLPGWAVGVILIAYMGTIGLLVYLLTRPQNAQITFSRKKQKDPLKDLFLPINDSGSI